ncbi:carbohydrate kinase family protein [Candidatus Micrarchaeota archaeon]|jgi:sugar/nucleoside kinase (ribokinase family)|nr:carbohydrate kinase family protein [Candidatus Micrarchaeota archaeon]
MGKDTILCIGNMAIDHKITQDEHEVLVGGAAYRVCLGLMLFGQSVKLISAIGKESLWEDILSVLSKNKVDTTEICVFDSSIQFITTYDASSNISHFSCENIHLADELVRFSLGLDLKEDKFIHICPFEASKQSELILKANASGKIVSSMIHYSSLVDGARNLYLDILPHLDFLFLNEEEAKFLAGSENDWHQNGKYLSRFLRQILFITLAENGSAAFMSGELICHCPPISLNITNTLGAGDCFVGGALSGYLLSMNPLQCLKMGSLSSMLALTGRDHNTFIRFLDFEKAFYDK